MELLWRVTILLTFNTCSDYGLDYELIDIFSTPGTEKTKIVFFLFNEVKENKVCEMLWCCCTSVPLGICMKTRKREASASYPKAGFLTPF